VFRVERDEGVQHAEETRENRLLHKFVATNALRRCTLCKHESARAGKDCGGKGIQERQRGGLHVIGAVCVDLAAVPLCAALALLIITPAAYGRFVEHGLALGTYQ